MTTIAVIQHQIYWEDARRTLAHVRPLIESATERGARLVVLPEMFSTGFSMAVDRVAEPLDGPSIEFLRDSARRWDVWCAGSVPVRPEPGGPAYNVCVVVSADGEMVHYRKRHPSAFGDEWRHYAAGGQNVTVAIDGVRVTPTICYDLRFADQYWETAEGTDCYLVVANWPSERQSHWDVLTRARAIENQAYVVASNRVGEADGQRFFGGSRIVSPFGHVEAELLGSEGIVVGTVNPADVADHRARFPFLADRRRSQAPVGAARRHRDS